MRAPSTAAGGCYASVEGMQLAESLVWGVRCQHASGNEGVKAGHSQKLMIGVRDEGVKAGHTECHKSDWAVVGAAREGSQKVTKMSPTTPGLLALWEACRSFSLTKSRAACQNACGRLCASPDHTTTPSCVQVALSTLTRPHAAARVYQGSNVHLRPGSRSELPSRPSCQKCLWVRTAVRASTRQSCMGCTACMAANCSCQHMALIDTLIAYAHGAWGILQASLTELRVTRETFHSLCRARNAAYFSTTVRNPARLFDGRCPSQPVGHRVAMHSMHSDLLHLKHSACGGMQHAKPGSMARACTRDSG